MTGELARARSPPQAHGEINAPPALVHKLVSGTEYAAKWDPAMNECRRIRKVSDDVEIILGHYVSPVPLIVSDREFIYLESRRWVAVATRSPTNQQQTT